MKKRSMVTSGLVMLSAILAASSLLLAAGCVTKEYPVTETYYETEYRTEYKTESYSETESVVNTVSGEDTLAPKLYWSSYYLHMRNGFDHLYYSGYELTEFCRHGVVRVEITICKQLQRENIRVVAYDVTKVGHITCPPFPTEVTDSEPTTYSYLEPLVSEEEVDEEEEDEDGGIPSTWQISSEWLTTANSKLEASHRLDRKTIKAESVLADAAAFGFDAGGAKELAVLVNGPEYPWNAKITVKLLWSDEIIEEKTVTKERQVPYEVPYQVEKQRTVIETKKVAIWDFFDR